jgi:peptidoglycan hydrolase CwlO-like protein
MADKALDSTASILRKIQSELAALRREVAQVKQSVDDTNERIESLTEYMAGALAQATEARGMAIRLKERMKRLEARQP